MKARDLWVEAGYGLKSRWLTSGMLHRFKSHPNSLPYPIVASLLGFSSLFARKNFDYENRFAIFFAQNDRLIVCFVKCVYFLSKSSTLLPSIIPLPSFIVKKNRLTQTDAKRPKNAQNEPTYARFCRTSAPFCGICRTIFLPFLDKTAFSLYNCEENTERSNQDV